MASETTTMPPSQSKTDTADSFWPNPDALRALAMDAVQAAASGHPGMPMGMAEIATSLWARHLNQNPANPAWVNRDRFVLSNGHGSMLLYGLLHLTGFDLSIDDLKAFRQLGSRTPGHPELGYTPGVETTTGPLGQGIANAVGMALAERILAAEFNRPGHDVIDHRTYAFVGDGCLMEGISHEVCSLAGTLGLGKLTVLYDDNGISIDGTVDGWFADDTPARFEAYGWHVIREVDGHDMDRVSDALSLARAHSSQPTLICCRTVIGKGSPTKAGSADSHGSPLGADEVAATRAAIGWTHPPFEIPQAMRAAWDQRASGAAKEAEWTARFEAYQAAFPTEAADLERRFDRRLPDDFALQASAALAEIVAKRQTVATRKASQNAIEAFSKLLPELVGGSADMAGPNLTAWSGARGVPRKEGGGNYVFYGVREFGMSAIMNGLALHGGLRPFGGTFLVFSDYARNALRMAALMKLSPVFVFTHDSIALGQDGPTHQPVEQLASLRMLPNMDVWRPCDTVETFIAWQTALESRTTPTSLVLSRQNLAFQERDAEQTDAIRRGGYVLAPERGQLHGVILATGSEVELAISAAEHLASQGAFFRVVSMPSVFQFEKQNAAYRHSVLPEEVPRLSVEAGETGYWRRYVGLAGACVGLDQFGESGPAEALFEHFNITVDAVVRAAKDLIKSEDGVKR